MNAQNEAIKKVPEVNGSTPDVTKKAPSQAKRSPQSAGTSKAAGGRKPRKRFETISSEQGVKSSAPPTHFKSSAPAETYAWARANAKRRAKAAAGKGLGLWKIPIAIVSTLAVIYLAGVVVFTNLLFMPRTTINGRDESLKSAADVAKAYEKESSAYALNTTGDNVKLTVKASDITLDYNFTHALANIDRLGAAWQWPVRVFRGNDITVNFLPSYDENKLAAAVKGAVNMANVGATPPTNATITYNTESKSYEITPEKGGTVVDEQSVLSHVKAAISTSTTQLSLGDDALVAPTILSDDPKLANAKSKANVMLAATQTLTVNEKTAATVEADQIAGWMALDDTLTPSVNVDAVTEWTRGSFSDSVDTVGTTRTYTTPYGKEVTVSGGTYGWTVDGAALAQTIANNITAGTATNVQVPFSATAATYNPGSADWPKRYIDADLSEQHARMYNENGELIWESDFVSGNPSVNHSTPEGVYAVNNYKGRNQTLRGVDENHDGQPDYTSHVKYWVPFVDNLVAFHDAWWRGSFGGSIYRRNGSHGCINLPTSAAAELYDLTEIGDVVVVHE